MSGGPRRRPSGAVGRRSPRPQPRLPSALLPAGDRPRELLFRHRRPPRHAELARALVELLLRIAVEVDAAVGLPLPLPLLLRRLRRARVARPLLVLRLPVVADLLVAVLERRVRGPVRPLPLAVLVDRRVVRLRERPLGALRRPRERPRQLRFPDPVAGRHLRHRSTSFETRFPLPPRPKRPAAPRRAPPFSWRTRREPASATSSRARCRRSGGRPGRGRRPRSCARRTGRGPAGRS